MSKFVIKKRVTLEHLEDIDGMYKGAYLEFKAIPLPDYEDILNSMPAEDPKLVELKSRKDRNEKLTPAEEKELKELMQESGDRS